MLIQGVSMTARWTSDAYGHAALIPRSKRRCTPVRPHGERPPSYCWTSFAAEGTPVLPHCWTAAPPGTAGGRTRMPGRHVPRLRASAPRVPRELPFGLSVTYSAPQTLE